MQLTGEKTEVLKSSQTSEIIERIEILTQKLDTSTTGIKENLDILVGQEPDTAVKSGDPKIKKEGKYGKIHELIDDLFVIVAVNEENNTRLNTIV